VHTIRNLIFFSLCSIFSISVCQSQNGKQLLDEAFELFKMQKFGESIVRAQNAIRVARSEGDCQKMLWAEILIGRAYKGMNDNDSALAIKRETIHSAEQCFGQQHPAVALACDDVGDLLEKLGKFDEALIHFKRALKIREMHSPPDSEQIATSYSNIAKAYSNKALYADALSYYEKCLRMRIGLFGEKYKMVAEVEVNIATVLLEMEKYDSALVSYNKALKTFSNIYGGKHYVIGIIYNGIGTVHYYQHYYDTALEYFKKALAISLSESNDLLTAKIYGGIASTLNKLQQYKEAFDTGMISLELKKRIFGENHLEIASALMLLGEVYVGLARVDSALMFYTKALDIRKSTYQKDGHPSLAECYFAIATVNEKRGLYETELEYLNKGLEIRRRFFGKDGLLYATGLITLADLRTKLGRYSEAESLLKEAVSIQKASKSIRQGDYLITLNKLALLCLHMGRYPEADSMLLIIGRSLRSSIDQSDDYGSILLNLGGCYVLEGRYAEAESVLVKAKELTARADGTSNLKYAEMENGLALLYVEWGKYDLALRYSLKALNLSKKILGQEHPDYGTMLNNLGLLYYHMGRYTDAETVYQQSKRIRATTLGVEHPDYAIVLDNLGLLYVTVGKYPDAERLFQDANTIIKKRIGEWSPDYAKSLENIASLFEKLGRFKEASRKFLACAEIRKVALGKNHPEYAQSLVDLADVSKRLSAYSEAENLYIQALRIQSNIFGSESQACARTLNSLSILYESAGRLFDAESCYTRVIDILRKKLGLSHPDVAYVYNNLAEMYLGTRRYAEAESLFVKSARIIKESLGRNHPSYAYVLSNIANLYALTHRSDQADSLFVQVVTSDDRQIWEYFPTMSENEKLQFYSLLRERYFRYISFSLVDTERNPRRIAGVYNNTLRTKALIFDATSKVSRLIRNSGDSAVISRFNSWISAKEYLAKAYTLSKSEQAQRGINVDSLEQVANDMEKELSLRSESFKSAYEKKLVTWQEVQSVLKPGEAAIEILRFRLYDKRWMDTVYYAALIVTPETKDHPELVLLENGNDLESSYIKKYRELIRNLKDRFAGEKEARQILGELYRQYWQKIQAKLKGIKKVYLSLDGVYNQINPLTLFNSETGRYLLEDLNIQIVTNTKDLVTYANAKRYVGKNTAELFGFPDYWVARRRLEHFAARYHRAEEGERYGVRRDVPLYGRTADSLSRSQLDTLYGSKREVEGIERTLELAGWDVHTHLWEDALEEAVKAVNSPRVLVISTHGYFLEDVRRAKEEGMLFGMQAERVIENPLLRSGLLLAGAQQTLSNDSAARSEKADNGILTAYEGMNLDLDNTELVVLSACETGLGEVKNGEGVYGLQRAFQVAGARTIIMSLWKVSDEATQELMTTFFTKWLSGMTKQEAFKQAQLQVKAHYPEPYYWGAFVMVGE
jgi:tetratricopeptide (TPR) repeat protein